MKNLKLQFCNQIQSDIKDIKFLLIAPPIEKTDKDSTLYLVTADTVYEAKNNFAHINELAKVNDIVGATFLVLNDEICLATANGQVLSISPESGALNENSFCDVGILCMEWSPEQEVVVFVTKTYNVVVMTCTYDPMTEHLLTESCDQEQFMNVGWGRKETQFHGSEGKGAAVKLNNLKTLEKVQNNLADDVHISWRNDGAFFVVSFLSEECGRIFKTFDKEGTLQFVSEKLNGLQPPIAWRPSGNWIAIPHDFPNKSTIGLFEKNGLRHQEIGLHFRFEEEKVVTLKWSESSDILAILTEEIKSKQQRLYLYTIGNYKWYLKQTLHYNGSSKVQAMEFDSDSDLERTLHVFLQNGLYFKYRWTFVVDKFEKNKCVAVIDGKKLMLTNFAKAILPPPMCSKALEIENNINSCSFFEDKQQNDSYLHIYDDKNMIHVYKVNEPESLKYELCDSYSPKMDTSFSSYLSNFIGCSNKTIVGTYSYKNQTHIVLISLDEIEKCYKVVSNLKMKEIINTMSRSNESNQIFAHTISGSIQAIVIQENSLVSGKEILNLIHPAVQILLFHKNDSNKEIGIISLCKNQSLYINDQHIADYVTSLCLEDGLRSSYLLFTKHTRLHLIRLENLSIDTERNIESGGKLVTICGDTSCVILQMPRGNLEAFYPRLLLVKKIGDLLDRLRYEEAMNILVKQRINLNIICDHDIIAFVKNLPTFVEDISNVQWLNLFLSDLRNEDVTTTVYASNYDSTSRNYPPDFDIKNKVGYICEKILEYMENSSNSKRFTLPIITAKVKANNIEAALLLIWKLKKDESGGNNQQSEGAIKYLLYLVDVTELYNIALGTYDFGLVLFVAQKTQKDPREFLPFLNSLNELEVDYRNFKIDEHLKRYDKALLNISKCKGENIFDESLEFITRHQLYSQALKLYKNDSDFYKRICLAYGDHLRTAGHLDNASLMYERGDDFVQALRCAKNILDWRRVITLSMKTNETDVGETVLSILPALQEKGKFDEAFYLLKEYGRSFEEALNCLVQGNHYLKAIFETHKYDGNKEKYIENLILPNLLTYTESLNLNILDSHQLFEEHKERLKNVRKRKQELKDMTTTGNWNNENLFDESDLLSDTTSMRSSQFTSNSRSTSKTSRSGKNRRKHERKHFSLKPGNPFEEIALIDALYNQIKKIEGQQESIHDTCKALLELNEDEEATKLQRNYKRLIALMIDSLLEIWTQELASFQPRTQPLDLSNLQDDQRYGLLDPVKRFKPDIKFGHWEHILLS